jgi:3-methyladenine DNA glycosylase Tag
VPACAADYFRIMSRAIFQAGLSWKLIESKWPAYERLFEGFDPDLVAAFGEGDIDRIAADPSIVRTRRKIAATVENARTLRLLEREYGSFAAYLRGFGTYAERSADLKRRFHFLGELSVYYLLFLVGEDVPPFEEWERTIPGDHPRMREMIALARSEDEHR